MTKAHLIMSVSFCSRSCWLLASGVFACSGFLLATSSAQMPTGAGGQSSPHEAPNQATSNPLDATREPPLTEVQVTGPDFVVELPPRDGVVGSLSILVPVTAKEAVVRERGALEAALRQEIESRPMGYRAYCAETPWHLQGDHSRLSTGIGLLAASLITRFNEVLGANLVWGFKCDLWNYETRPI